MRMKTELLVPVPIERVSEKNRSGQRSFFYRKLRYIMHSADARLFSRSKKNLCGDWDVCDESMNDRGREIEKKKKKKKDMKDMRYDR